MHETRTECTKDAFVHAQNLEIKLQQVLINCHALFCQMLDMPRTHAGHVQNICRMLLGHVRGTFWTHVSFALHLSCTVALALRVALEDISSVKCILKISSSTIQKAI